MTWVHKRHYANHTIYTAIRVDEPNRRLPNLRLGGMRLPHVKRNVPRLEHFFDRDKLPVAPLPLTWYRRNLPALAAGAPDALGNDQFGDCVPACLLHCLALWRGYPFLPGPLEALDLYKAVVPTFNPDDPSTDIGADPAAALDFVMRNGMLADGSGKIDGYVMINPADPLELGFALWAFGALVGGFCFTDAAVGNLPSADWFYLNLEGQPNPSFGHCVPLIGATHAADGGLVYKTCTWGFLGDLSRNMVANYFHPRLGGVLYVPLFEGWADLPGGRTPSGFKVAELQNYLKLLR